MTNALHTYQRHLGPGRSQCRPQRQPLQVINLHKALRKPSTGPITNPEDAVYECLTLLRRPDLESLAPFLPPGSFDPAVQRVELLVGGDVVTEAGPLAACHTVMDTAARRVLPGHLLRRCRVLSSVQLGTQCAQRVALTACTGEEAVFVWRLRRVQHTDPTRGSACDGGLGGGGLTPPPIPDAGSTTSVGGPRSSGSKQNGRRSMGCNTNPGNRENVSGWTSDSSSSGGGGGSHLGALGEQQSSTCGSNLPPSHANMPSTTSSPSSTIPSSSKQTPSPTSPNPNDLLSSSRPEGAPAAPPPSQHVTDWLVESIERDNTHDDEELTSRSLVGSGGGGGGGPHPRLSPELVVKGQLAALQRGDVVGAAGFNLWSRSTSGGWDLHLAAWRSLLSQPSYRPLIGSIRAELGASALPSPRRMLQEVKLVTSEGRAGLRQQGQSTVMVYQLGMQANGCWVVEAIRAVGG